MLRGSAELFGEFDEAERSYSAALSENPTDLDAMLGLAEVVAQDAWKKCQVASPRRLQHGTAEPPASSQNTTAPDEPTVGFYRLSG